jgi:hypothetical protein
MRLLIRILTPLVLLLALLLPAGGGATAASAPGGKGANVIKEFVCFEGGNPGAPALSTTQTHAVITPSGNTKLTCHFEGPPVKRTVNLKDVPCGTFLGPATNSHFVYTKSGHATLTCQVKHQ